MIRIFDMGDIVPTGGDGAAVGNVTTGPVNGKVLGVYIDYDASQAAPADLIVATVHAPIVTLLTITDSKTDGWYYPRHQVHGSDGTALTMEGAEPLVEPVAVRDYVKASVAQADDTHPIRVYLVVEDSR